MPHPELGWIGASPDGRIGDRGLLEVKCPVGGLYGDVPPYYMAQVQGQLECEDRDWCDFIVWKPRGGSLQRIVRSRAYWAWMLPRLAEFWAYVVADIEPPRIKRKELPDDTGLVISTRFFLNAPGGSGQSQRHRR